MLPSVNDGEYYTELGQGASSKLVKLFYKKINELISTYYNLMCITNLENEEDLPSYYAGISTELRQIENKLSNSEPWNVNHLVLSLVIEQHKITWEQNVNKEVQGFNLIFSKGKEEALRIIHADLVPLFLPPCRQIVVCRG